MSCGVESRRSSGGWLREMRPAVAIILVGCAVAAAVYLGSVRLGHTLAPGNGFQTGFEKGGLGINDLYARVPARADWQIPVAILIGTLGFAGAVAVARVRRS